MVFYHPGTVTQEGRRNGNDGIPKKYDDPGHTWHLANTENWGAWSCCGGDVKSKGCAKRETRRGMGAKIKFFTPNASEARVVGEDGNSWLLSNGCTANKASHGSVWIWAQEYHFFRGPQGPFYSFGNWGCHMDSHVPVMMTSFSSTPPGAEGAEISGTYKIIFVAAVRPWTNQQRVNILLRRQPRSGSLIIEECAQPFTIGVGGRLGTAASTPLTDQTAFSGEVFLPNECRSIDKYFGSGYKFFGFDEDSEANSSYPLKANNSSLIVTRQNDNKGRIYRVQSPIAFKKVSEETEVGFKIHRMNSNQYRETAEARRLCKRRHFSFLCHKLGLPCSAAALISEYATEMPYIFAETGDIWIDICLSTKTRTYVLARRKPGVLSAEKVMLRANNMRMRYLLNRNEHELLSSVNEVLDTPNAGAVMVRVNLLYAVNGTAAELGPIIKMNIILYKNRKVSKSDVQTAMMNLIYHIEAYAYDNPLVYDYIGKMFSIFLSIGVLTVNWLYGHAGRLSTIESKVALVEGVMKAVNNSSLGKERTKDCFAGPGERGVLGRLIGLQRSRKLLMSFCK